MGNDKSVVGVLQNGGRKIIVDRVVKLVGLIRGSRQDELLENIGNDDEQIRRDGIALPETVFALNPASRNPVKNDSSFTGRE